MFLVQNFLMVSNMPLVFFYGVQKSKSRKSKNDVINFRYILQVLFLHGALVSFVVTPF